MIAKWGIEKPVKLYGNKNLKIESVDFLLFCTRRPRLTYLQVITAHET